MTVSSSTSRIQWKCNGSLTEFPFIFGVGASSEIQVILTDVNGVEAILIETTDYIITSSFPLGGGLYDLTFGGKVTTVKNGDPYAYATGYIITILRNVPITQESDFTEGMPTLYETFEDGLDKLTRIAQQIFEITKRMPRVSKSSSLSEIELMEEPGEFLKWNKERTKIVCVPEWGTGGPLPSHHETHEKEGGDEISLTGLSGLLADPQTPLDHHEEHENGGNQEISIAGLSGLLADDQHVLDSEVMAAVQQSLPWGVAGGILFTPSNNNPILPDTMEESLIMDGDQCDNWYRNLNDNNIYYAYSTDPWHESWTVGNNGDPVLSSDYILPFVFKVGSIYYMAVKKNADGNLYLFSSTDKITWTIENDGNPILEHSSTPSSWYYEIFNAAIAVVGNDWHLLIEGKASGFNFRIGYSKSTLAAGPNFNTNLSASIVLPGFTACPYLLYVPNRNALLSLHSDWDGSNWFIRASFGFLTSDLSLPSSWIKGSWVGIKETGIHITDATLVFTDSSNKPWKTMLGYNYNQLDGYRGYSSANIDQLFDYITKSPDIKNYLPWMIDIDPFFDPKSQANWDVITVDSECLNNGYRGSDGNQNAEITWDIILAEGTWTLNLIYLKGTNHGIFSIDFDGIQRGTIDGYAGSASKNNSSSVTEIIITMTSKIELKLKMATKNGNSSGYYGDIQGIRLLKTG